MTGSTVKGSSIWPLQFSSMPLPHNSVSPGFTASSQSSQSPCAMLCRRHPGHCHLHYPIAVVIRLSQSLFHLVCHPACGGLSLQSWLLLTLPIGQLPATGSVPIAPSFRSHRRQHPYSKDKCCRQLRLLPMHSMPGCRAGTHPSVSRGPDHCSCHNSQLLMVRFR